MKFQLLIKTKMLKNKWHFAFKLSNVEFYFPNVNMPTIIILGILTFLSKIKYNIWEFESEKKL